MNCPKCQTPIPDGSDVCPLCAVLQALADDVPSPRTSRMAKTAEVLAGLGFVTCGLTPIPGLVLGLVACGLTAVLGLILGLMAYKRIVYSEGRLIGRGHAISAVILSLVAFPFAYARFSYFNEIQTGGNASRTERDIRSAVAAAQSYWTDNGTYALASYQLTTPVQYIAVIPHDVFSPMWAGAPLTCIRFDARTENGQTLYDGCVILSRGPDKKLDVDPARDLPPDQYFTQAEAVARLLPKTYDATNGTYSKGDILRISVAPRDENDR